MGEAMKIAERTNPIASEEETRLKTSSNICTAQMAAFGKLMSYGETTILSDTIALRLAESFRLFTRFV